MLEHFYTVSVILVFIKLEVCNGVYLRIFSGRVAFFFLASFSPWTNDNSMVATN
jgi:hypothetical protein